MKTIKLQTYAHLETESFTVHLCFDEFQHKLLRRASKAKNSTTYS